MTAFLFSAFVGTDGARVTHVKLTFPPGERDYTTRVPTFIILCAHTHLSLYILYTQHLCVHMCVCVCVYGVPDGRNPI